MVQNVHFHGLCLFNVEVKGSGGKAHLAIRAFFPWSITGPHTSAIAQYFHWTPILKSDEATSNIHIVSGPVWDDSQGAHTYDQCKWFDKKINVTIKKQKEKKGRFLAFKWAFWYDGNKSFMLQKSIWNNFWRLLVSSKLFLTQAKTGRRSRLQ